MSGESAGLPTRPWEKRVRLTGLVHSGLQEKLELLVEAAVCLRDIVSMKPILNPFPSGGAEVVDVYARAARAEQYDELIRRATAILEQLGLGGQT